MTTRRVEPLIVLAVAVLGIGGWLAYSQLIHSSDVIRYRLTVDAMTPDGPKTESGIIEVTYGTQCCVPGFTRKGTIQVRGEAIPVTLGSDKILFVTLTNGKSGRDSKPGKLDGSLDAQSIPIAALGPGWEKKGHSSAPVIFSLRSLPDLVTFDDIENPRTVKLVQPEALANIFGAGYSLNKVTFEITEEPPTKRIEGILPWLNKLNQFDSDSNSAFTGYSPVGRKQFIQGLS